MRFLPSLLVLFACANDPEDPGGKVGGENTVVDAGAREVALDFVDAIGGSVLVNPAVENTLSLAIVAAEPIDGITVTAGGGEVWPSRGSGTDFEVDVPIGELPDGVITLEAEVTGSGTYGSGTVDLRTSVRGVQITDFEEVGGAATPKLHFTGDALWLTWADRRNDHREAFAVQIDGAGRFVSEPITLVSAEKETLNARAAIGNDKIAVLYQHDGGPYTNHLVVVDMSGTTVLGPMDLDPSGMLGGRGGSIAFDGEAFVAAWRSTAGSGQGAIRWLRIVESTLDVVGPVDVAVSGNDDPIGAFQTLAPITLTPAPERTLIGFVRDHWHPVIDMAIPKAQVVSVSHRGDVMLERYLGGQTDYLWYLESKLFSVHGDPTILWSTQDLTSSEQNIPTQFYASRSDGQISLDPTLLVEAPEHRTEPTLFSHPTQHAVMAWLDQRSRAGMIGEGHIQLFTAAIDSDLIVGEAKIVDHARFIEGTSELFGTSHGRKALLTWVDERHGQGLFDPKPEIWFETVWF